MARRKLTERQKQRIGHNLTLRRDSDAVGEVVTRHGRNLAVLTADGALIHCQLRQNIGEPVCGDRVTWQASGDREGVVTSVLERGTELCRPNTGGRSKALAANFTRMVVVLAPEPEPVRYLLDQYLVAAELIGVSALIVLNKLDLLPAPVWHEFEQRFSDYASIGYTTLSTSAHQTGGLTALRDRIEGHTCVLVGQSGVGKSSIAQQLIPDREIQIGRLSEATGLGRHTTSAATLYTLPHGGRLIDSPGVRSFRLGKLDRPTLERGFREFHDHLGHCRFNDCAHGDDPGCALRAAVDTGAISALRLANFRHLLQAE